MREPMVRRGRLSRQQRLLRTGIGVVVAVAVAALIANALGGGSKPGPGDPETPRVAFVGAVKANSNSRTPRSAEAQKERDAIIAILNDWYQRAFVDPELYGNGTFPEVAARFAKEARASFTRDIPSLTIGDARDVVERVEPTVSKADVTVYFDKGTEPRYAVAVVRFAAKATQKEKGEPPIDIDQRLTLHFQKIDGQWLVTYYKSDLSEEPIVPSPSATPSS